jgi:hypothetical protein
MIIECRSRGGILRGEQMASRHDAAHERDQPEYSRRCPSRRWSVRQAGFFSDSYPVAILVLISNRGSKIQIAINIKTRRKNFEPCVGNSFRAWTKTASRKSWSIGTLLELKGENLFKTRAY